MVHVAQSFFNANNKLEYPRLDFQLVAKNKWSTKSLFWSDLYLSWKVNNKLTFNLGPLEAIFWCLKPCSLLDVFLFSKSPTFQVPAVSFRGCILLVVLWRTLWTHPWYDVQDSFCSHLKTDQWLDHKGKVYKWPSQVWYFNDSYVWINHYESLYIQIYIISQALNAWSVLPTFG